MISFKVNVKSKTFITLFISCVYFGTILAVPKDTFDYISDVEHPSLVLLDHARFKREDTTLSTPAASLPTKATLTSTTPSKLVIIPQQNATVAVPGTAATTQGNSIPELTSTTPKATIATPAAVVTQIPLLGVNGTGILRVDPSNKTPKVSEPITPDEEKDLNDIIESIDTVKAQKDLGNLTMDTHTFYSSVFIGNQSFFDEHWANITKTEPEIHNILSNSHRKATTVHLSFDFPFYGLNLRNITVATGGFIYTGDHVHQWLAATQYIAPLMANFDTSLDNNSYVKLYDDGEKFTALWENVSLEKEDLSKKFTFAVTLYRNGDITFAYKSVPIPISKIDERDHPVKVGISDAYYTDRVHFYVRRKMIYEYDRITFGNHEIVNNTVLRLIALPTCLQYDTCTGCVNHRTSFNCSWCELIRKCSSGTDRNKQDWLVRGCDRSQVKEQTCPAPNGTSVSKDGLTYVTDTRGAVIHTADTMPAQASADPAHRMRVAAGLQPPEAQPPRSPAAGAAAALFLLAMVVCIAGWLFYAFKNPHTRSGQLLIKYRPSQWGWRRGEARYTAATIHM